MKHRLPKRLLLIVGLVLVICVSTSIWLHVASYYDSIGVAEAAERIGVSPTLKSIQKYIEDSLHNGMSKQQLEEKLQQVAPITVTQRMLETTASHGIGPHSCDSILIKIGPFYAQFRVSACYDQSARLISWGFDDLD